MRRTLLIPALLTVAVCVAACSDDPADPSESPTTEYGSAVSVGNGTARSYIVTDDGTITEIGIALSATALDNLPPGQTVMDSKSYTLPLPTHNTTGYQLVEVNWNPAGHPPPMVYTVPHFDFHFYTVSQAERDAILPTDPNFGVKAANFPADAGTLTGYAPDKANDIPQAVPRMGLHWVNTASHEFHGTAFTHTFVVGSWNGKFTFLEPMVSLAYLKTKPDVETPAETPGSLGTAADRPTAYRVSWDATANEYRIGLTHLGGN